MKQRAREFAICVTFSLGLLGCGDPPPPSPPPIPVETDFTRTPVVFVHGRLIGNWTFDSMLDRLVVRGWPKEYLYKVDLVDKDMSNVLAAESQLAPEIEAFLDTVRAVCADRMNSCPNFEKVDLVAHSMGAVSSRWYAAKLRPDRVRTWISLAGANHGSAPNCPGPVNSGKRDLCPAFARSAEENPVQFALNGSPDPDIDESPFGIGADTEGVLAVPPDENRRIFYLTLRVTRDEFVSPPDSPILDGAGGIVVPFPPHLWIEETSPGNYLVTGKMGHDELPMSDLAAEFVEIALSTEH